MSAHASTPRRPLWVHRLPFFYGWIVVTVAFVTMGIGVNARTSFSLLYPPILAEFGWNRGETAAAFSIGFLVSSLYAPFIGWLMDRLGPRLVIPLGVVLVSVGMLLATRVGQPWHLYATLGVLVVGGSVSLTYIGHSLFLPNWFVRRRGLAIGIAFAGVGIGSIVLFPWIQYLIDTIGWRYACMVMALLLLIVLLPLNFLFQRQRPEHLGLLPDGDTAPLTTSQGEVHADNVVDPAWAATDWTLARALKTARFWWVFVGFFCGLYAWYAVQVHQTKYLVENGFSNEMAAYALGLVGLTGIVGTIALGHLSDRFGREWAWTLSGLGYVCCYGLLLAMKQSPSPVLMYLMVASQGLLGYGLASVFGAIPIELFQGKHYGAIFGTISLASGCGAAAGPWVTGVLYDSLGSYTVAFWLAIGFSLCSIVCIWFAAPRKVRAVAGRIRHIQA